MNMKEIVIYTDGSCQPNPGPGGWAAVILFPDGTKKEISGSIPNTTNNRMEMLACLQALQSVPVGSHVRVVTDSQYVQQGMTNWVRAWKRRNWGLRVRSGQNPKPVKNKDLWMLLDEARQIRNVTWGWCRGHDGNEWNERCDELASLARASIETGPKNDHLFVGVDI